MPVRGPVDVYIREESIRLGQFLKLADFVEAGSDAKELIRAGEVLVNGEQARAAVAGWRCSGARRSVGPRCPTAGIGCRLSSSSRTVATPGRSRRTARLGVNSNPPQGLMLVEV
jgi:hypothetical protein